MSNFSKVGIFMKTFGQEVKTRPSFSSDKINKLRIDLIKEELEELTEAMNNKDLLEVADALTDILYVTYGAGHAFGIDLDKCFDEVQNSNMSIRNLKQSVKIAKKYYETEASGNVTLKTVKEIASTGVNRISVGSITHSAPAVDFKLEI